MSQLLTAQSTSALQQQVNAWHAAGQRVVLVPTMGNLHAGHLSLVELAREHGDRVVCSIFVNPTQFGPDEDLERYPRTLGRDREMLERQGYVDLLYLPELEEIYPFGADSAVLVTLPPLSNDLCGAFRPGHFDGVASVVLRLLNVVGPDVLVLGEKDFQQKILVERMICDLQLSVEVVAGEIYREPDGLAMSSRNAYLTAEERGLANELHAALADLAGAVGNGSTDYSALESAAMARLEASGFRPDYVSVRRAKDLAPPEIFESSDERIVLAAAWLGRSRLIDNVRI